MFWSGWFDPIGRARRLPHNSVTPGAGEPTVEFHSPYLCPPIGNRWRVQRRGFRARVFARHEGLRNTYQRDNGRTSLPLIAFFPPVWRVDLARPAGLEPATCGLEGHCSSN